MADAAFLSDGDVGIAPPKFMSDADVGLKPQAADAGPQAMPGGFSGTPGGAAPTQPSGALSALLARPEGAPPNPTPAFLSAVGAPSPDRVTPAVEDIASRVGNAVLQGYRNVPMDAILTPQAQDWVAKVSENNPRPNLEDMLTVGHAVLAGSNAVFQGGLEGIAALGDAVGQPLLGRDVAGYFEAAGQTGAPHAGGLLRPTLPETRAALTERALAPPPPPVEPTLSAGNENVAGGGRPMVPLSSLVNAIVNAPTVDDAISQAAAAVQKPSIGGGGTIAEQAGRLDDAARAEGYESGEDKLAQQLSGSAAPPALPADNPNAVLMPGSVGAATSRDLSNPNATLMPPDEFLANRLQGETERLAAPPRQNDSSVYIPGVQSTLAEVTGDPVAAMDQAYNRQQPEALTQHTDREGKTADLVADYYATTAGSAQTLRAMERARDEQATKNIQAVFGNPQAARPPADPTPTLERMQQTLDDPRQAERDVIRNMIPDLMSRLYDQGSVKPSTWSGFMRGLVDGSADPTAPPAGAALKSDPYALYGVGEHINDLLKGVGNPETSSAARVLRRELMQIKESLYDDIEDAAPGFAQYRADYQAASRSIDAMKLLQDERLNLLSGSSQHITPTRWFNFMRNVVQGRADPMDPASSLSEEQMDRLWNITDQLKRSTFIDAGKPRGSWTSMMQEWGGRFAEVGAHLAALHFAPVIGNVGIGMAKSALRARSVRSEMNRVLNPDPTEYPPISLSP